MKLTFNINNVTKNKMFDVLNITREKKKKVILERTVWGGHLSKRNEQKKCVLTAGKTANSPDWPAPLLP